MLDSPSVEFQVFRGKRDDRIIEQMAASSICLGTLCERGRGEEVNKAGKLWICPSCSALTTPGTKVKGGGYNAKACPQCGYLLLEDKIQVTSLIVDMSASSSGMTPYVDGDDINRRYQVVRPTKEIRTGVPGWSYKPTELYVSPKIMIRQAGIGMVAALDQSCARCPQSVYIYRLCEEYVRQGYAYEYVLAALLSRTMTYYIFKQYGEIDPAKAHSKLTHDRLESLPIPSLDLSSEDVRKMQDSVVACVQELLTGSAMLGGEEDAAIEMTLRQLWHVDVDDGAYINGQFYGLDNSQVVQYLFPGGPPLPQDLPCPPP